MAANFFSPKKPLTTFSLAGLTDIVLLLLIFFLLTSSFIPSFGIQVNLPQSQVATPAEEQFINVAITEDGRYFIGQTEVPADSLEPAILAGRGDKTAVVLRADEKATVGQFATVANIAKSLNLRVLMATELEDM